MVRCGASSAHDFQYKKQGPGWAWALSYLPLSSPSLFFSLRQGERVQKRMWTCSRGAHTVAPQAAQPPSPQSKRQTEVCGLTFLHPEHMLCYCRVSHGRWAVGIVFFFPCEKKSIEEPFGKRPRTMMEKYTDLCKQEERVSGGVGKSHWEEGKLAAEFCSDMHV